MRVFKLLILFIAGLLSSLIFSAEQAFAADAGSSRRVINDSLVQNLECSTLSVDSIYRAIREDAFHEDRNIPLRNWPFRHGLTVLAGCWGLSSNQRMISYLARYNTSSSQPMERRVSVLLDMIRGESLEEAVNDENQNRIYEGKKLNQYSVFAVEQSSLAEAKNRMFNTLWQGLETGYRQLFSRDSVQRNFQNEIEARQANQFFRGSNIKMALSGGPRSPEKNQETWAQLKKNLDGRRLTLLNLRASRTTQHIVMAKSYRASSNGVIEIVVYDSNRPIVDAVVYFDSRTGHFTAPQIFRRVTETPTDKLGVFIVDEEERIPLEKAMLAHYSSQCR